MTRSSLRDRLCRKLLQQTPMAEKGGGVKVGSRLRALSHCRQGSAGCTAASYVVCDAPNTACRCWYSMCREGVRAHGKEHTPVLRGTSRCTEKKPCWPGPAALCRSSLASVLLGPYSERQKVKSEKESGTGGFGQGIAAAGHGPALSTCEIAAFVLLQSQNTAQLCWRRLEPTNE